MTDYDKLKVPDLKKLLQERSLSSTGNKVDLIARLKESDDKKLNGGDDEIDWDEDDTKVTSAPAAASVPAKGQDPVKNSTTVPDQTIDTDPSETTDVKATGDDTAPTPSDSAVASSEASKPEAPKQDFSMGLEQTDAEKEAGKRAARAKRFGMAESEEEKKKAERAKKFSLDAKETVVKGLDDALPERRPKRGREGTQGGRVAKRQTPGRRTGPKPRGGAATGKAKKLGQVTDDPTEKAKADKRAERFKEAAAA